MSKILVTGANGMLGANLVRELVARGENVRAMVRRGETVSALVHGSKLHPLLKNLPIEFVEADLKDLDDLVGATQNVDLIYHCAGLISYYKKDTERLFQVNVEGTRNVLEAARRNGVKRIVHVSSVSAIKSITTYGSSKKQSEEICREYVEKGLDVVIVRPSTIFGAGDINGHVAYLFRAALNHRFEVVTPGTKSYVHVSDVADAMILVAAKGHRGQAYPLTGQKFTFGQIFSKIAKAAGRKVTLINVPMFLEPLAKLVMKFSPYDPGLARLLFEENDFDSSQTQADPSRQSKRAPEQAIKEMLEFYIENKLV